jgi:hypothetical protein
MASTGHLLLAHRCPLLPALHGDAVADGLGMLDAVAAASSGPPDQELTVFQVLVGHDGGDGAIAKLLRNFR